MDPAELERLLRRWGRTFGEPPPPEWDEESSDGSGALTGVLIDFMRTGIAPIGPEPFGEVRRMGPDGVEIVTERRLTAKGTQSAGGNRVWHPNLEAQSIETAWLALYRCDHEQAVILKTEYCTRGSRKEKIVRAAWFLSRKRLTGLRYRIGLQDAKRAVGEHLSQNGLKNAETG